jgi:hypothetical protein
MAVYAESTLARSGTRRRLQRVIDRDGDMCVWCSCSLSHNEATLEHAVPCSDGGSHRLENLLVACSTCNNSRRSTPLLKWFRLCQERGYEVRVDIIMQALDRMSRNPEKMRKPQVILPLTPAIATGRRR